MTPPCSTSTWTSSGTVSASATIRRSGWTTSGDPQTSRPTPGSHCSSPSARHRWTRREPRSGSTSPPSAKRSPSTGRMTCASPASRSTRGAVESALESDPLWSDDLDTVDADVGSYYDWNGSEGRPAGSDADHADAPARRRRSAGRPIRRRRCRRDAHGGGGDDGSCPRRRQRRRAVHRRGGAAGAGARCRRRWAGRAGVRPPRSAAFRPRTGPDGDEEARWSSGSRN